MRKTIQLKVWIAVLLTLICSFLLCMPRANKASAEGTASMRFDFSAEATLSQFTIVQSDVASTATLEEGKLVVNNVSGITELRLPEGENGDYVIAFTMERVSGETTIMNGANKVYPHPYFGVKYRMSEDYQTGYEVRLHYSQATPTGNSSYNDFDKETGAPIEISGRGLENWEVASTDVMNNQFQGKNTTFSYYRRELALGVAYDIRIEVTGKVVKLFINDECFLKDILENQTANGRIALNVMQTAKISVSDLCVYTLAEYAEAKCAGLKVQDGQSVEIVEDYVARANDIEEYFERAFTESERETLDSWLDFLEQKELLNTYYQLNSKNLPKITVAWQDRSDYVTGKEIILPAATAVDVDGNTLATKVSVRFGDREVKMKGNAFTANEAGSYTVVYSARDVDGQTQTKEFTLTVAQAKAPDGETSVWLIVGIVTLSFSVIGVGAAFLVKGKKGGKQ